VNEYGVLIECYWW